MLYVVEMYVEVIEWRYGEWKWKNCVMKHLWKDDEQEGGEGKKSRIYCPSS